MYSVYFIIFESKKENCMSQNTVTLCWYPPAKTYLPSPAMTILKKSLQEVGIDVLIVYWNILLEDILLRYFFNKSTSVNDVVISAIYQTSSCCRYWFNCLYSHRVCCVWHYLYFIWPCRNPTGSSRCFRYNTRRQIKCFCFTNFHSNSFISCINIYSSKQSHHENHDSYN